MKKGILEKNVVVITGASRGIGQQIAYQLSNEGAWLALAARNAEKLKEVAEECMQRGGRAIAIPTDVADPKQCQNLIERTVEEYGRIDTLINNAAIAGSSRFEDYKELDVFEKIVQVNFMGSVYCTHYALPYLKETNGRVVGISSIAGKCPKAVADGYTPSKYAVTGFYDSLRLELSDCGVTVTAIYPGWVNTGITSRSLLADGTLEGKVAKVESKGMPVDSCARVILRAIKKRKREAIMPTRFKSLLWINLAAPKVLDKISLKLSNLD